MKINVNNPAENVLTHGVSEEHINTAVEKSGYPLQTMVAIKLQSDLPDFFVTEEKGYTDRDGITRRSMDVFAYKQFVNEGDTLMYTPCLAMYIGQWTFFNC
jgi:hypothetical protein